LGHLKVLIWPWYYTSRQKAFKNGGYLMMSPLLKLLSLSCVRIYVSIIYKYDQLLCVCVCMPIITEYDQLSYVCVCLCPSLLNITNYFVTYASYIFLGYWWINVLGERHQLPMEAYIKIILKS
jgi:hypothetical protein